MSATPESDSQQMTRLLPPGEAGGRQLAPAKALEDCRVAGKLLPQAAYTVEFPRTLNNSCSDHTSTGAGRRLAGSLSLFLRSWICAAGSPAKLQMLICRLDGLPLKPAGAPERPP